MFLLFPTGHEQTTARRWPFVCIGLVVTNLLVFVLLRPIERAHAEQVELPFSLAVEQLRQHPYLAPPPLLASRLSSRERALLDDARARVSLVPEGEQERLDELARAAQAALARVPSYRFGYRPADANWLGLVTHQFLHGGWLHLLGNLWFLWLAGYVLEDGWGRVAFPVFYLGAGLCGALGHHLAEPHSALPLIGASGAIAGLMGAFLVRNATTRIRFFMWLLLRPFRFQAPAYVMLPLWFGVQLFWGFLQAGGVAYFAHVGGFVFGVVVALVLRRTGIEGRLDSAIENRGVLLEDPRIAELARQIDDGRAEAARFALEELLAREPRRIDACLELLRCCSVLGDAEREQQVRLKLLELYLQQGLGEGALSLYEEWSERQRLAVPPSLRLRIARHYERAGHGERALDTLHALHARPDDAEQAARHDWAVASAALIAHAELALKLGLREEALALFTRAQAEGDPQWAQVVKHGLTRAAALPERFG
jgi:membrane associated rhomboid family serine protease